MTTESMRERFEAFIFERTGRDIESHISTGTVGLMFAWEVWQAATLAERERCAMMFERMNESDWSPTQCAEAIRKGE